MQLNTGTRPHAAASPRDSAAGSARTDWRSDPRSALLVLRAFLAFVFLYAGLSKIADRRFLDSSSPISIHQNTLAVKSASPIGGLLGPVIDHSFAFGLLMALAETAVGIGLALGLLTRIAALGGMLLTFSLFLTVSWQASPWYTGADIVYVFALTPLLLAGATPFSLDDWLRRRQPVPNGSLTARRAVLLGGAAVAGAVAVGAASLFRTKRSAGSATAQQSDAGTPGGSGSGTTLQASDVPVGGGKQVADARSGAPIWVLQLKSGDFTAFSATCPHQGCPVKFQGASEGFVCPCHSSAFGPDGSLKRGPATRGLTKVSVSESGGTLKLG